MCKLVVNEEKNLASVYSNEELIARVSLIIRDRIVYVGNIETFEKFSDVFNNYETKLTFFAFLYLVETEVLKELVLRGEDVEKVLVGQFKEVAELDKDLKQFEKNVIKENVSIKTSNKR